MNEQKTGLSENELEQVSGGAILPDNDRHRSMWESVLRDLQRVLERYMAGEGGMDRQWQRKLGGVSNLTDRCLRELESNRDLLPAAMDLYNALTEFHDYSDIERLRMRLRALL